MRSTDFHGLVPPLLTPFTTDRELDEPAMTRVIEHLLTGVHGLFLLGTTAEFTQLNEATAARILKHAAAVIARRVPVAVHVTHTDRSMIARRLAQAVDIGADAVVLTAPYYFRPSQDDLFDFVTDVAAMSELPLMLYNMPGYTKVSFGIPLVRRLLDNSRIVGIKDSSGSAGNLADLCGLIRERPDFRVFVGLDTLFSDCIRLGGHGAVIGSPYLAPRLCRRLYETLREGNVKATEPLQATLNAITSRVFFSQPGDDLGVIKSIKSCCQSMGLCGPTMSWPHRPLSKPAQDTLAATLAELKL
jgi:2-dehydro-3-deoxy-D-pentonate aldolase